MNGPSWFDKTKIKVTLDARPILEQGKHPLEQVINETAGLNPGDIYEIITPFPPAPMIEKMAAAGFETHAEMKDGLFSTFFCKK